jgi:hypothetical protein
MAKLTQSIADDLANYQAVLDSIYGEGICTVKQDVDMVPEVLGAVNSPNFKKFADCFLNRLRRLATMYPIQNAGRQKVSRLTAELTNPSGLGWSVFRTSCH